MTEFYLCRPSGPEKKMVRPKQNFRFVRRWCSESLLLSGIQPHMTNFFAHVTKHEVDSVSALLPAKFFDLRETKLTLPN